MYRNLVNISMGLILAALFVLTSGIALANGPARTTTLAAGPYIVDVNLYQDPPYADTPLEVTVVPHDSAARLQGRITVQPGLGTDAIPLHFDLAASGANSNTLKTSIRMPVRGAWNIVVELSGPKGSGSAQFPVTVAAPGAIPTWLGWLIGSSPLLFIAWWVYQQHRYRNRLVVQQGT